MADWYKPEQELAVMTNDEKRIELAKQFQYWLDINERHHSADGTTVEDSMHVTPPNWPTRGVLKEWINILTHNDDVTGLAPEQKPKTVIVELLIEDANDMAFQRAFDSTRIAVACRIALEGARK